MKNRSVFTHPWEVAFDECQKRKKTMARGWIRKWISEQKDLPLLNCEAAQILDEQLGDRFASDSQEEAVSILAPYFDVGHCVSEIDEKLRAELPAQREVNASAAQVNSMDLKDGSPIPKPHAVNCLCDFCESHRTKFAFNQHERECENKKIVIPKAVQVAAQRRATWFSPL